MNINTDDNGPSGVGPHEMKSWREKYEYVNSLWLKQKDEILRLHTETQKTATEIQGQLAKKNMEIMKLEADKYTLFTDIARLQEELSKKDTECISLRTSLTTEVPLTELHEKTKEEEVKHTTEPIFSTELTILLIVLVSILVMNIVSQKSSPLLLTIDETSLLLPSP